MFKILFRYPRVSSRHASGPLAEERKTFLSHLQSQGVPRSTLLRYASHLLLVAGRLVREGRAQIARAEITRCATRWARGQRRRGRAQTMKWPAQRFGQVACAWCSFMGWLRDESPPQPSYASQLDAWASFLHSEGLSEITSYNYCWWASGFLQWLKQEDVRLRLVSPARVDGLVLAGIKPKVVREFRIWLGHVSLQTTHIYAESDLKMKARALARCEAPLVHGSKRRSDEKGLMSFLRMV